METDKLIVSHSEAELHSRCEWAHHYAYGYNLTPKETAEHIQLGSLVHQMFAGYYQAIRDGAEKDEAIKAGHWVWQKAVIEKEYDLDICNRGLELFDKYVQYFNHKEWEILWVEEYTEYLVADKFILNGELDLVVRAKTGKLFGQIGVVDHKICYNFMTKDAIGTHSQIPKYVHILNKLQVFDQPITFGIINQIRWRSVSDVNKMFSRVVIGENDLTEVKTANFIAEYLKQAERIAEKRALGDPSLWKGKSARTTIKDICKYCDFSDPCIEELEGRNPATTLKVYFKQKDLSYRKNRTRVNGKPRPNQEGD